MNAFHVIKEVIIRESLIVHTDHTEFDYIPYSARKQQSRIIEMEETFRTRLLQVGGDREGDDQQGVVLLVHVIG